VGAICASEGALHSGGERPTGVYASFCGQLQVGWRFCEAADPRAKGAVERLQGYLETNFAPSRRSANALDLQLQLDAWFDNANARTHKTPQGPSDRQSHGRAWGHARPARAEPDTERRWAMRVPPDPYLRFDTNDYSLHPALVLTARDHSHRLDTGELAAQPQSSPTCFGELKAPVAARALAKLAERARSEDWSYECQR